MPYRGSAQAYRPPQFASQPRRPFEKAANDLGLDPTYPPGRGPPAGEQIPGGHPRPPRTRGEGAPG